MKRAIALLIAFTMAVAACGGGEDDPAPAAPAAPAATDAGDGSPAVTQAQVTIPPPDAPVDPAADDPDMVVDDDPGAGEGSSTEFCAFIADVDESQQMLDTAFDGDSFREAMEATIDAMQRSRDLAPSEIEEDVDFVLDRFLDFIELLEEYQYNLIALGTEAASDPRLQALESAEFQAAVDRIGDFCGIDLNTSGESDGAGTGPGGGGDAAGELPAALVPPGVVDTADIGGGAVLFSSNAPFADLVDFYTQVLGEPLFVDDTEMAALFQGSYEGTPYSVSMAGGDGTIEMLVTAV